MMPSSALPQEIVLLVCQALAVQNDFSTLFRCSLVSRRVASIALEQLYSTQELSSISAGETVNTQAWARLWKSIIRSSIGKTAYPYCTYVRALYCGHFEELLDALWTKPENEHLRSFLINANDDTEQFFVAREGQLKRPTRKQSTQLAGIDFQAFTVKCGDFVTKRIREVADQTETAVALAHLEGNHIPVDVLPNWISRLPALTSLRLRDGSVLTAEAGRAIFESCPRFSELTVHYYRSSSADDDMASFLQNLRQNTLQRFELISLNDIGERTLTALNGHAESLRFLSLGSLSAQAMKSLNVLSDCTALEFLEIENALHERVDLKTYSAGYLKEVSAWVQSCQNLRGLRFSQVQDALLIIKEALNAPTLKLSILSLEGFGSQDQQDTSSAWAALGVQENLEDLTLGGQDRTPDGLVIHENPPLAESICRLHNLKCLNLNQAYVRMADLKQFVGALPNLTELRFGGEWMDDDVLESLGSLRYLNQLSVNSISIFTWEALREFAMKLDPVHQQGIVIDINNQLGAYKFGIGETTFLSNYFADTLKGSIEIEYYYDPGEHDSDTSSASD
ncbi:uncharacterized protein BCR38DRAFT_133652 [Pseudomassariella vexata]|uniref:F-box domain-containing protein n=1 Tax=Pseudomassariella vexata TaxID=1141098 RepID=A0A1Y2EB27_9PEZI|nr:uncharacterized protein BCR38DRAFT_133652 [Pseudomassariella vexata]ORY68504.1 hypothetical protein BCR38DRAFT_133652 [Pseudomassariella vexata]